MLHVFVFALFPVLFPVLQEDASDGILEVLLAAGLSLLFACGVWAAFRRWIEPRSAEILASVTVVWLFSFGYAFRLIEASYWSGFRLGTVRILLPIWTAAFAVVALAIVRRGRSAGGWPVNAIKVINVTAAALLAVLVLNYGYRQVRVRHYVQQWSAGALATPVHALSRGPLKQDVYYIVVDGYARGDVLRDVFGFDNRDFHEFLRQRGFYVAHRSVSNYAATSLSLASSLNARYIDDVATTLGSTSSDLYPVHRMIRDSVVMRTLKAAGYRTVAIGSGWGATRWNEYADVDLYQSRLGALSTYVLQNTVFKPLAERWVYRSYGTRDAIEFSFEGVARASELPGPKFVFAHIVAPHPPFVFGPNGEPVDPSDGRADTSWGNRAGYVQQLQYVNKRLVALVDRLSAGAVQPIIIIQADHGPASSYPSACQVEQCLQPTPDNVRERMSILNAYLLPGDGRARLYDSISPANTFRIVLRSIVGGAWELLPDKSYYSSYVHPYAFTDVSAVVRRTSE